MALLCCVVVLWSVATPSDAKKRKFKKRECLDCHEEFVDEYLSMSYVHPGIEDRKCEGCHLRHGIVGKLILKEEGNQLCSECHTLEDLKLDAPGVHTALKEGTCSSCHNPHASNSPHLLNSEGNAVCFECHEEQNFSRAVVHEVLNQEGCAECHLAHASPERHLLTRAPTALCVSCH